MRAVSGHLSRRPRSVADDGYAGQRIPRGSIMLVSIYGLHRNPPSARTSRFFVPNASPATRTWPRRSFMPFGAGEHVCLGIISRQPTDAVPPMIRPAIPLARAETLPSGSRRASRYADARHSAAPGARRCREIDAAGSGRSRSPRRIREGVLRSFRAHTGRVQSARAPDLALGRSAATPRDAHPLRGSADLDHPMRRRRPRAGIAVSAEPRQLQSAAYGFAAPRVRGVFEVLTFFRAVRVRFARVARLWPEFCGRCATQGESKATHLRGAAASPVSPHRLGACAPHGNRRRGAAVSSSRASTASRG